jgi:hypothetical protein
LNSKRPKTAACSGASQARTWRGLDTGSREENASK